MPQLRQYRQVVPRYPPLRDLPVRDPEDSTKVEARFLSRRRKRSHLALLGSLVARPYGYQIAFSHEVLERLYGIREDCRVLPQELFHLLPVPDIEPRSRLAMTDDVGSEELVEKI